MLFNPANPAAAAGLAAKAAAKSSGTTAVRGESYACSQRPSAFARSTSAKPAGRIRPASISAATFSRLIFDQMLRFPRGV